MMVESGRFFMPVLRDSDRAVARANRGRFHPDIPVQGLPSEPRSTEAQPPEASC